MKRALQKNDPSPLKRLAVRAVSLFSRYSQPNLWKPAFPLQTLMYLCHSERTVRGPWATMPYGFLFSILHWPWTKVCDGKTEDNLVPNRASLSCLSPAVAQQCCKSRALMLQPFCEVVVLLLIGCSSNAKLNQLLIWNMLSKSFWVLLIFIVEGTWCHREKVPEKTQSS